MIIILFNRIILCNNCFVEILYTLTFCIFYTTRKNINIHITYNNYTYLIRNIIVDDNVDKRRYYIYLSISLLLVAVAKVIRICETYYTGANRKTYRNK